MKLLLGNSFSWLIVFLILGNVVPALAEVNGEQQHAEAAVPGVEESAMEAPETKAKAITKEKSLAEDETNGQQNQEVPKVEEEEEEEHQEDEQGLSAAEQSDKTEEQHQKEASEPSVEENTALPTVDKIKDEVKDGKSKLEEEQKQPEEQPTNAAADEGVEEDKNGDGAPALVAPEHEPENAEAPRLSTPVGTVQHGVDVDDSSMPVPSVETTTIGKDMIVDGSKQSVGILQKIICLLVHFGCPEKAEVTAEPSAADDNKRESGEIDGTSTSKPNRGWRAIVGVIGFGEKSGEKGTDEKAVIVDGSDVEKAAVNGNDVAKNNANQAKKASSDADNKSDTENGVQQKPKTLFGTFLGLFGVKSGPKGVAEEKALMLNGKDLEKVKKEIDAAVDDNASNGASHNSVTENEAEKAKSEENKVVEEKTEKEAEPEAEQQTKEAESVVKEVKEEDEAATDNFAAAIDDESGAALELGAPMAEKSTNNGQQEGVNADTKEQQEAEATEKKVEGNTV